MAVELRTMARYVRLAGLLLLAGGCTTRVTPQDTARYLSGSQPAGIDVAIEYWGGIGVAS